MLVATPGQTTAYTLHNNNNGNAPSNAAAAAATKKQQTSVNISSSSSSGTPKSITTNNKHNSSSNTPSSVSTTGTGNIKNHNNFSFHTPPTHKNVNSSNDNASNQQHSLKNSDNSKPLSFINNLKDTVQKALVTTVASLSRNCNQTTINTTSAIKTTNSSSNNYNNTSKIIASTSHNVTSSSSSSSVATNKFSSIAIANTSSLLTPASTSSTILPLSVARKKCTQSLGVQPKLHTIPPTILHRYPEERQQTSSTDSLQKEMYHFKPIRTVPTTPWKSGSKSRGSSLRFPKANLATTKTEFILKSNCDVNNRMKKKQPSKLVQNEAEAGQVEGDDNNDEQENKAYYERFKPKPSTLHLFADFETPNHQSAFVCLVAHMKNLINIQSTKMLASPKSGGGEGLELQKTKSTRTSRIKGASNANPTTALSSTLRKNINVPMTEIFVRPKKFKSPAPPAPANKKSDLVSGKRSTVKTLESPEVSKKISKINELSGKVTKAKSRRKLTVAKSNITNLVELVKSKSQLSPTVDAGHSGVGAENEIASGRRPTRKRKITPDIITSKSMTANTNVPATPTLRSSTRASKSARLSIDTAASANSSTIFKHPEINVSRVSHRTGSFSPPLTRARRKLLIGQQHMPKGLAATPIVDVKKRKVLENNARKSVISITKGRWKVKA